MSKTTDLDLYGILEVEENATEKQIIKAYRKKALKCHPDKNPDNPQANELFHELSKALEILTDAAAKAAYDKTLKAKKAAELRHKELDSKRKKFKEDLEAREQAAQDYRAEQTKVTLNFKEQVERLRKEGSKLLEEEQERLAEELKKEQERRTQEIEEELNSPAARLKIRWKAKKSDPDNGGYSEEFLLKTFSKYGEVVALLISSKKTGSAVLEFSTNHSALLAVENEIGLPSNPISLTWLSGQPANEVAPSSDHGHETDTVDSDVKSDGVSAAAVAPPLHNYDFESLVLHRMRQAEERKRLIDEIQDGDDT